MSSRKKVIPRLNNDLLLVQVACLEKTNGPHNRSHLAPLADVKNVVE